ncbi:probable LRR receptor-like serine/threonine-protein kinase At1g53430 isoform X2 [Vitis riparia]|uniref:probable LRR receptor-like serine/threonine-protein kinase At1g53430 isoform X2 n=1 Tax=Vitis riparia TaxID=96939 RepID=UPI00155A0613|nr:probable LRR receptor-like serine/threonine-protein kinase At1g53430 isoform X2 [Vitis riparia]
MENLCKIKLAFAVEEANVYSFGIVALEIVSGRSNITYRPKEECIYRLDWWKKQMFTVLELLPWKLSVEEATLLIGQKRNASIVLIGHSLKGKGNLMGLVDPRLGLDFNKEEIMVMINIALLCTNVSPAVRPAMPSVVNMLEGRIAVPDICF